MRILFPTSIFYPSQAGGPANSVYFLAKELVKQGMEVFVFTTTIGINDLSKIKINEWNSVDGMNVYYSDRYWKHIPYNKILISDIPKVNLFHFSSFFDPFNLYFMILAKKRGTTCIISPRGELLDAPLKLKKRKKRIFLKNYFVKFLFKNAILHVTSDEEEGFVKEIYSNYFNKQLESRRTIFKVTNMLDNNLFSYENKSENKKDYKYILYLGRISRKKNIELLIEVYSKLDIDKNIKLFIAGNINEDIKYGQELKNKVKNLNLENRIIFSEKSIEGKEKEDLYYNAELFVTTTRSENFGMVILESLIRKTPVVTTKGTPWEELNRRQCGYWVDMELNSIKSAIENYFSLSDDEKNKMKEKGFKLAKEFSSEKLINEYVNMYRNVLNQ